jgi:NADPH:quinone reductase-like Zn-dependent oxidoreductase
MVPMPSTVAERTPTLVSPSVLGQDSSGAVVELKVGQTVLFEPGQDWVPLMIDGSVLRVVTQSGGYPSDQPLKATILAVAPGTASIDDFTDAACFHTSPPCLRPEGSLHFSVVVTE